MKIIKISCCFACLALIVGLTACGSDTSETNLPEQAGTKSQMPVQTPPNSDDQLAAYSGKVMETKDVSPYTYVRLVDGAGNEIWAS